MRASAGNYWGRRAQRLEFGGQALTIEVTLSMCCLHRLRVSLADISITEEPSSDAMNKGEAFRHLLLSVKSKALEA